MPLLTSSYHVPYTATLAVANNTVAKINVISFSMGAGEMANGDVLVIEFDALVKANTNNAAQLSNVGISWGTTNTIISNTTAAPGAVNWGDGNFQSIVQDQYCWLRLMRVGNDLHIMRPGAPTSARMDIGAATFAGGPSSTNSYFILSAPPFGTAQTVSIQVQHSLASAELMFNPQIANIYKITKI